MSEYKEELEKMRWSFSRVKSYIQCPYGFYLKYIVNDEESDNFYAFMGKTMHECLERIFKKERTIDESIEDFETEYLEHKDDYGIRDRTKEKAYELCMDYLCQLDLKELRKYKILGVELKITLMIEGYDYVGYIDLLLEDKKTGEIIILDHKSNQYPFKKNGGVFKNSEKEFEYYKKQMYLYCNGVYEKYGKYPRKIVWNHFKEGKYAVIDFNKQEFDETMKWFVDTIHQIENDKHFVANTEFFYCVYLCGFRYDCEYKEDL